MHDRGALGPSSTIMLLRCHHAEWGGVPAAPDCPDQKLRATSVCALETQPAHGKVDSIACPRTCMCWCRSSGTEPNILWASEQDSHHPRIPPVRSSPCAWHPSSRQGSGLCGQKDPAADPGRRPRPLLTSTQVRHQGLQERANMQVQSRPSGPMISSSALYLPNRTSGFEAGAGAAAAAAAAACTVARRQVLIGH